MESWQERSLSLIGNEKLQQLAGAQVLLFGLGGVGGFACEALARSGIGALYLVDRDRFARSNLNRQLGALQSTLGRQKTEVMAERIRAIRGEDCKLTLFSESVRPEDAERFFAPLLFEENAAASEHGAGAPSALVIDAIDDLEAKLAIARICAQRGLPLLICGGCGRRLDPGQLRFSDLAKTENDPLLKRLRRRFREEGLRGAMTLWSAENPRELPEGASGPSSMIFVPAAAGLLLAARAVAHFIGEDPLAPPRFQS